MSLDATPAAPIVAPAVQPTSILQPAAPAVAAVPAPVAQPAATVATVAAAPVAAVAPVAVAAPAVAQPVAASQVPVAQPAASEPTQEPHWLNPRLERARAEAVAKALKDLGVENIDAAKAAIAQAKALEEANKSEIQRITERATKAEAVAAKVPGYEQIITGRLAIEEQSLTEVQRATVLAIAGDDPATRLRTIDAMRPSWAVAAPAAPAVAPASAVAALAAVAQPVAVPPAAPPAPAPLAAPVQTMPTTPAPAGASVPANDHLAEYEKLVKDPRTQRKAALYLDQHSGAILPAMEARRAARA